MTMHLFLQTLLIEHNTQLRDVHIIQDNPNQCTHKRRTQSSVNLPLKFSVEKIHAPERLTSMDKSLSFDFFGSRSFKGRSSGTRTRNATWDTSTQNATWSNHQTQNAVLNSVSREDPIRRRMVKASMVSLLLPKQ